MTYNPILFVPIRSLKGKDMAKVAETATLENIFRKMVVADPKDPGARLREIKAQIKRLEVDEDNYFGFEDIEDQIEDATRNLTKEQNHILRARQGFKELDYSFLAWRKKDTKLPAFIIVELESEDGKFRISVEPDDEGTKYEFEISPDLPEVLRDHFEEVMDHLAQVSRKSHGRNEISITSKLRGVMSDRTLRKKVEKFRDSGIFDEIYIIAEADTWKIDQTSFIEDDPLVVGWDNETEQMFLIGSFDLTPLEEHLQINFTH